MILIADSSALIALAICEALPLLEIIFTKVRVPTLVFNELTLSQKKHAAGLAVYLSNKLVAGKPVSIRYSPRQWG